MDRIRTDIRQTRTEPKNYIAINRKRIVSKKPHYPVPTPQPLIPHNSTGAVSSRRVRSELTPRSDIKRSIEQLASIISRGDLDKILQLAKVVRNISADQQPNQLSSLTEVSDQFQPQSVERLEVRVVQPISVTGLSVERDVMQTRNPKCDAPIPTPDIKTLPPTSHQPIAIPAANVERHYGRGQGLRQLLELDNSDSTPHPESYTNVTNSIRERHKREKLEEECYYPWGKPGAGAPLRPVVGHTTTGYVNMVKTTKPESTQALATEQRHEEQKVVADVEPSYPRDEKRRKAFRYMLELQAQVREKERAKREQQAKQSQLDRIENERIEKERERFLLEAEKEKERILKGKKEAHQRFQFLQAKIEEQQQLAQKERHRKFHPRATPPSSHMLSTHSISGDAKSDTTQSPKLPHKDKVKTRRGMEVKGRKVGQHLSKNTPDRGKSNQKPKQGNIRNPPPSQLNVIKPCNRSHLLARDNKSSSMPTIRQTEAGRADEGAGNCPNLQDDCYSDASKTSTLTSSDRAASLTTVLTETQNTCVKQRFDKEEMYPGENQNVISQLQKLKQGLYMKQQELRSEFF